ncbi:hypothetical protein AGDE_15980 [Angomonas deanei]|uniref:Uncharacterized protein n=1 Tax=Angomonas deanei TaxID=59799 RepID=A0A7G2CNS6_9TRYP|nr:hypothetical protein AGDE_15980 [Angomonas deanei]CAD2220604.1 hypothetical protein, conserved [Angomonas deanei]|eukprot:EPY17992.1 hypothetical protein AGDE_15980 [Angomonas deanei]
MREATLKEALKKVSNDAAKIVSQRNALLEREQAMQETLTTDFLKFFEKERDRMEKMFFVELSSMTSNFTRLVKEQRLFSSPEKQKYERELSIVEKSTTTK